MKHGPVTKLDKKNTAPSKKNGDDVMSENRAVIDLFSIYGQFAAIRKQYSGCMAYKTYISINNNLLFYKN